MHVYVYNDFIMDAVLDNKKNSTWKKIADKLPHWLKDIHSLFYYYLFMVLLGVVFFSTSLFINYFTTPFTGDYSSQQFAFYTNGYDDWWHFLTTGEFVLYDRNTFLGVDNVGANSFYYLFDPFFLPILLCPRQLIPQGMAVLTILKMALAGLTFYAYMRYLGASKTASKITGLAYGFSGWISWYLWFNHFTGVAVVFPLILLGIEILLKTKKPWVLSGAICFLGFVNFFFCICFVMCAFLYAMFRYFQRIKLNTWKDNLIILIIGFFSFLVGLIMPMMVVFPSAMYSLNSPRASGSNYLVYLKEAFSNQNFKQIIKLLTSWTAVDNGERDKARVLYPFIEFIFPATTCRGTSLTIYNNDSYDNVAGSFYCFLPMLLLLFPAFIESMKQKHFSVIAPVAFFVFALFTPCFYYLFHGFTVAYSRWTLFVVTSILAYTGLYLDKLKSKSVIPIVLGWSFLLIFIILACISANYIVNKYDSFEERVPLWLAAILEIAYVTILTGVLCLIKLKKKIAFHWVFTGFLVTEISLMGAFVIQGHGVEDYYYTNKGFLKNDALHALVEKTKKNDPTYYRSFSSLASATAANDEMRNDYNGFNFFHSLYNYNTADLCNWSSISNGTSPGSWSGSYIQKRINLDTLLGVKYYYVEDDYYKYQNRSEATSDDFRYNVPLNYIDVTSNYNNEYFRVYKNMDYIDFALTYDQVYKTEGNPTEKDSYTGLYSSGKNVLLNEELYLSGAIINTYNDETVADDISNNHPDIFVNDAPSYTTSYYYDYVSIGRYKSSGTYDAIISYYDMYSADTKSLNLIAAEYLELDNSTTKYTIVSNPSSENNFQRYVEVIEAVGECFPDYDPKGNIFYVSSSFAQFHSYDIYFVDVNNEIVTYDNHNDGYYSSSRSGKERRGFYISPTYGLDENGELVITKDAPKIKKIIFVQRSEKADSSHQILIDTYTKHELKMNTLKEYMVSDVHTTANTYKFKTNFDKERIVVTRLAYEKGFSLIMKDENGTKHNINVFNAQGGFVSFISGTGNCSYELTFETPYLKISSLFSSLGVLAYFSSLVSYLYFDFRRKEKDITKML